MIKEICYAKINLILNVIKRLENNYHELEGVMCSLDFYDVLYIENNSKDKDEVISSVPIEGVNIIDKSIHLIKEKYNIKDKYVKVKLEKNIFIGAGLAGGSSNAAGIIRGLDKLWDLKLTSKEMEEIALKIGADVPYCLYNKMSVARGIGEKLTLIENNVKKDLFCLLINPNFEVSTQKVFENYQLKEKTTNFHLKALIKGFKEDNFELINGNLVNDLEDVTLLLYKELFDLKKEIESTYHCSFHMSGSGPTLFLLNQDESFLHKIASEYKEKILIKICRIL